MPNVFDSDVAIRRIRDLFGIPYESAKNFYNSGQLVFSVPVTDQSLSVTTTSSFPSNATGAQTIVTVSNGRAGTAVTAGTGANAYTVTAGKKYYVTSISIGTDGASSQSAVTDNGVAGTNKVCGRTQSGPNQIVWTFPTPIEFSTNVFFDISVSQTMLWTINGYEQ